MLFLNPFFLCETFLPFAVKKISPFAAEVYVILHQTRRLIGFQKKSDPKLSRISRKLNQLNKLIIDCFWF